MRVVHGATHYFVGQPDLMREAVSLTTDWLRERSLIDG
jgi:hypothetical protein